MADETVVFEAEVSKMLKGISQIEEAQKRLRKSLADSSRAAKEGQESAIRGYISAMRAEDQLIAKKRQLEQSVRSLVIAQKSQVVVQQQVAAAGTAVSAGLGKTNAIVGQLSYALDDFLTVVGTTGLVGGLRAASNNLSVVAASFNPMLAILPSAITLVAQFAMRATDAKDAVNELSQSLKKADELRVEFAQAGQESGATDEQRARMDDERKVSAAMQPLVARRDNINQQLKQFEKDAEVRSKLPFLGRQELAQIDREREMRPKLLEERKQLETKIAGLRNAQQQRVRDREFERMEKQAEEAAKAQASAMDQSIQSEQEDFRKSPSSLIRQKLRVEKAQNRLKDVEAEADADFRRTRQEKIDIREAKESLDIQRKQLDVLEKLLEKNNAPLELEQSPQLINANRGGAQI